MDPCLIAMSWWSLDLWVAVAEVTVGLGFIIFVHELGHFTVAKLCGVKVEKFYLGFDIGGLRLCRFRRGETEYGVGILPLGGYVKMLGQEDNPAKLREEIDRARQRASAATGPPDAGDPLAPDEARHAGRLDLARAERTLFDPRSYLAQSVPRRIAIISAGVVMNLIFAEVLAVIAFGPGVRMAAATVGQVAPGGGAWQVGLQSGDEVLKIGDRNIRSFRDIFEAIALGDVENGVSMVVDRPGVGEMPFLVPTQRISGHPGVGIGPSEKPVLIEDDDVLPFLPGSPASEARPAFQRGDRFLKLGDQKIEEFADIRAYLASHRDGPIDVTVERSAGRHKPPADTQPERVTIRVGPNPVRHLGLVLEMGPITAIQQKSPAEQAGLRPGDLLETLDGKPIVDPMTLGDDLRSRAGQTVTLGVSGNKRQGTEPVRVTLGQAREYCPPLGLDSPVAIAELGVAYRVRNTVRAVPPGGPAGRAGLVPGDLIDKITIRPPGKARIEQLQEKYGASEEDEHEHSFTLGEENPYWPSVMHLLQRTLPETTVKLQWSREGQSKDAVLEPVSAPDWFNPDRGWRFEEKSFLRKADSLGEAVRLGTRETIDAALVVSRSLQKMGTGQVSARNLVGPWGILKLLFGQAMLGPGNFLIILTLLSANLAVVNFLPIPLLDGGHFVLLLYEGIRGKPASERVQEVLTYVGLALILGLMFFVVGLDFGWIPRPGPGQ
ncbi:MAG: site-2 protease family protein [Thermoguttaceae bacterium]